MGDCLKRNAKNVEETSITRKRRRVNVELSDNIDSRRLCCTPPVSAATSCSGGGVSSSDVSNDHTLTFVDDEAKSVKELFSRSSNYQTRHYNFSTTREATPPTSSEIMKTEESPPPPPPPPQQPPTPEELNEAMLQQLEDFLTAEENLEMEYFARKYNFDFVNECPLEGGQYEWEFVGDEKNKKP